MGMKGGGEHLKRLRRLASSEVTRIANQIVYEGADTIRASAHRSISAGSVSGKNHTPSAPGSPPNRDTGVLQVHLGVTQSDIMRAEVRSDAPYARALEFGTSKMSARPYLRPARDKEAPKIRDRFATQMNKLVKRSG